MCGKPADSREHRYKKSELKKIFPPKPKNKPYHANDLPLSFSFDSGLVYKINSPDSDTQKYPPLICKDCNTANTQNLDRAYDKFSDWCWNNPEATFIDLNSIWGANYIEGLKDLYGYIIKVLGCEILSSGFPLPKNFPNPLNFNLDSSNIIISVCKAADISAMHPNLTKEMTRYLLGKGRLLTHINEADLHQSGIRSIIDLVWYRQIGNFQINIWYKIEHNPLLGDRFNGGSNIYNILNPGLDFFDIDYAMCSTIYGTMYIEWLQQKADEGHGFPYYKLGKMNFSGTDDIGQNYEFAAQLYKLAAERNHVKAYYDLAWMYLNGVGVKQNYEEAMKWCEKAINDWCYLAAHYLVGFMYENGLGVIKDHEEALRRYQIAADADFIPAQYSLGVIYFNGIGAIKSDIDAFKWYKLAAEQGYDKAQNNLGCMYASVV